MKKKNEKIIQKITNDNIQNIEERITAKEKEIMTI